MTASHTLLAWLLTNSHMQQELPFASDAVHVLACTKPSWEELAAVIKLSKLLLMSIDLCMQPKQDGDHSQLHRASECKPGHLQTLNCRHLDVSEHQGCAD